MKPSHLLATIALVPTIGLAGSLSPGWHDDQVIAAANTSRYYRYYVPETLKEEPPVVIHYHGGTQSMRKIFRRNSGGSRAWEDLADREGFLLIVPNGTNPKTGDTKGDNQVWNDCRPNGFDSQPGAADDIAFTDALIDWAESEIGIDETRVYATGASNGGMMSFRVAMERPERIAAIAAFIATLPADSECTPGSPVPVMIANATGDRLVKWEGGPLLRNRGDMLSAKATVDFWLDVNGAGDDPDESGALPDVYPDDDSIIRYDRYLPNSDDGAEVLFYTIEGGGHSMPTKDYPLRWLGRKLMGGENRDAEGAELAWDFFQRHALAGE